MKYALAAIIILMGALACSATSQVTLEQRVEKLEKQVHYLLWLDQYEVEFQKIMTEQIKSGGINYATSPEAMNERRQQAIEVTDTLHGPLPAKGK